MSKGCAVDGLFHVGVDTRSMEKIMPKFLVKKIFAYSCPLMMKLWNATMDSFTQVECSI